MKKYLLSIFIFAGIILTGVTSESEPQYRAEVHFREGGRLVLDNFRIFDSGGPTHFEVSWRGGLARIYFGEIKTIVLPEKRRCEVLFKSMRKETYKIKPVLLWGESKYGVWRNWISKIHKIEFLH